VPQEFRNFARGTSEPFQRPKTTTAKNGHAKIFYSGFKLE